MDISLPGVTVHLALAVVAAAGYFIGAWRRRTVSAEQAAALRDMKRARGLINDFEQTSSAIHRSFRRHSSSVRKFRAALGKLNAAGGDVPWRDLSDEADRLLKPTMRLATELSHAYDDVRQHINTLMTFTEVRTDPLTGLNNRRALDETLASMYAMMERYGNSFSIAIFDIDHFKKINDEHGHLHGDRVIQDMAALLLKCIRETDFVARYGGEEFVVLMPETGLAGARMFAEHVRTMAPADVDVTVSGGLAMASAKEDMRELIARADFAMYSAKAAGRNLICQHDGQKIEMLTPGNATSALPRNRNETGRSRTRRPWEASQHSIA